MQEGETTYSLVLRTSQPDIPDTLRKTFDEIEKEFRNTRLGMNVKDKKLVPFELALDITVKVASGIAISLVIKLLERLWDEFRRKKVVPQIQGMDGIQGTAESYLRAIGVKEFKLMKRQDKGPYVTFAFEDEIGNRHTLLVTSFDLKILRYERME